MPKEIKDSIIGREQEQKVLKNILDSQEAEFLAIYGRRRVGKTYLIREFFSNKAIYFEVVGQKEGNTQQQIENFITALSQTFYDGIPMQNPGSWKEAIKLLHIQIMKYEKKKSKKMVVFLDELPWLVTKRSDLLQVLDYYWNCYWSTNRNFILVVCGSAASWMLDHLINARGGLHNRLTKTLLLKPYNLKGVQEFLKFKGILLKPMQILDIFMAFGGVPYYLKQVEKGNSASQIINEVCFQKEGLLYSEFDRLFQSLFQHSELHVSLIKAIAIRKSGTSRDDLIKLTAMSSGGSLNKRLNELESAGFIQRYVPLGKKKKEYYYRICDEYVNFYLQWIAPLKEKGVQGGKFYWQTQEKTPSAVSWKGYAFENICLKHIDQICEALNLMGIPHEAGSWRFLPKKGSSDPGAQIDLLFNRGDGVITLCEIKYSNTPFIVDKVYAKQLSNKIEVFENHFSTKKQIFVSMITTLGIKKTIWSNELIQNEVILTDLFRH